MSEPHPLELAARFADAVETHDDGAEKETVIPLESQPRYNPQLFENSTLKDSSIDEEYSESEDKLFGSKDPNLAILHEKPWHRLVAYMVAQGFTYKEIAERVGKTIPWISQLVRQPWFRDRLVRELKTVGTDEITALLKAEVVPSIQKVISLRDSAESETVRLSAAFNLIDRFCGKPTQKVETKSTADIRHTIEDAGAIDRELMVLEKQINSMTKPQN